MPVIALYNRAGARVALVQTMDLPRYFRVAVFRPSLASCMAESPFGKVLFPSVEYIDLLPSGETESDGTPIYREPAAAAIPDTLKELVEMDVRAPLRFHGGRKP